MAFVNYSTREINVKIVYYGPGLCGKTANLQYLYSRAPSKNRGRLISLATETERTLFFDFLPMNLGVLHGFKVRFHLYTVPGQVFYEASRKLILKGVDGLLFVADSDPLRVDANVESWEGLHRNLGDYGLSVPPLPAVVQYNKRDLPNALPVAELHEILGNPDLPQFESVATDGTGVFESLKALAKGVLTQLQRETLHIDRSGFASEQPAAAAEPPLAGWAAATPRPPSGEAPRPETRNPEFRRPPAGPAPAPRSPTPTPSSHPTAMAANPPSRAGTETALPPSPSASPPIAVGAVRPHVANPRPAAPPHLAAVPPGPRPPAPPAAPPLPESGPDPVKRRGFGWFRRSR